MAKQIIDIGVQGNDGTGDSIRESFRKVNENFTEIYAVFGLGGAISLSSLSDGPASYSANQIIIADATGSRLTARKLEPSPGSGISVSYAEAGKILLGTDLSGVETDKSPTLGGALDGQGAFTIGGLPDPTENAFIQFKAAHPESISTINSLAVNKGYVDTNFLKIDPTTGTIAGKLNVRSEPLLPQISDPDYDASLNLQGNYLPQEALPRKNVVRRQGDEMTGPLTLSDHPYPLEGVASPNGTVDLQAATKFYVDNSSFTSAVNLYVSSATGDDLQQRTPPGKEGRYWQYAYKTVGAAALAAENLIDIGNQEPGPYRQKIAFTSENGVDQTFSTIQEPSTGVGVIKGATLIGGNVNVLGYRGAFDLLQANRTFIQSETVAYINNKYVNKLVYNKAQWQDDLREFLDAVGTDLVLESDFNVTTIASSYFEPRKNRVNSLQLRPTIESLNFARDQILGLSYNSNNLSSYIADVVNAICYDLIFQSNYQSIQVGTQFELANTDLSVDEISEIIYEVGQLILAIPEVNTIPIAVDSVTSNTIYSKDVIEPNIGVIIAVIQGNDIPDVIIPSLPSNIFNINATSVNGTTNAITVSTGSYSMDDITIGSAVQFKGIVFGGVNTVEKFYIRSVDALNNTITITRDLGGTAVDLTAGTGSMVVNITRGTTTGQSSARDLLLGNISFMQSEVIAYLKAEYPNLSYDKTRYKSDVKAIIESIAYDMLYGGNTQSISVSARFWDASVRSISESEVEPVLGYLNRLKFLVENIIRNELILTTYQQTNNQYTNESLIEGSITELLLTNYLDIIKLIVNDRTDLAKLTRMNF